MKPSNFFNPFYCLFALVVTMLSCDILESVDAANNATKEAINAIDGTIAQLTPQNYETLLEHLNVVLKTNFQADADKIEQLISGTVRGIGLGLNCGLEDVKASLRRGLFALLGIKQNTPPAKPDFKICGVYPLNSFIDFASPPPYIQVYGMYFPENVKIKVTSSDGAIEIQEKYIVINMNSILVNTSSGGFRIAKGMQKIEVLFENRVVYTFLVGSVVPKCQELSAYLTSQSLTCRPHQTKGDNNFGGNVVTITISAMMTRTSNNILGKFDIVMQEGGGDFTRAEYHVNNVVLYRAPEGYAIKSAALPPAFSTTVQHGTSTDLVSKYPNASSVITAILVKSFGQIIPNAYVNLSLAPVTIGLVQIKNCIP